jgi:hypothetical protein
LEGVEVGAYLVFELGNVTQPAVFGVVAAQRYNEAANPIRYHVVVCCGRDDLVPRIEPGTGNPAAIR